MRQAAVWWVLPAQLKIFTDIPADERREIYPDEINDLVEDVVRDPTPQLLQSVDIGHISLDVLSEIGDDDADLTDVKWAAHMARHCIGIAMSIKTAQQTPVMYGFWTDEQMKPIAAPYLWVKPTTGRRLKKKKIAAPQELLDDWVDEPDVLPEPAAPEVKKMKLKKSNPTKPRGKRTAKPKKAAPKTKRKAPKTNG